MKAYEVTDVHGTIHTVECDFMFNNGGELVLRTGERGNTEIVAIFSIGQWSSCVWIGGGGRPKASGLPPRLKKSNAVEGVI